MAITFSNRVGKTRKRLAKMLNEYFPDYDFQPENLNSEIPARATSAWGHCSWAGVGKHKRLNLILAVHSYHPMLEICQRGIGGIIKEGQDVEIFTSDIKR